MSKRIADAKIGLLIGKCSNSNCDNTIEYLYHGCHDCDSVEIDCTKCEIGTLYLGSY